MDQRQITPVQWIPREEKDKTITFAVDPDFHAAIHAYCKESKIKVSQLCRFAVARALRSY